MTDKSDDGLVTDDIGSLPDEVDTERALGVLDALRLENDELKDKALRAYAEMDNLRRRTAKEVMDARSYGVASFARDMISVVDNLERAIAAVPDEKRSAGSDEFKAFIEGVEMTHKQLLSGLENSGTKRLDPLGEKFDPNFHDAMFEVTDSDFADNHVAEVIQAGYVIGDRVLRPAGVGVSKGGKTNKSEKQDKAPKDEKSDAGSNEAS